MMKVRVMAIVMVVMGKAVLTKVTRVTVVVTETV